MDSHGTTWLITAIACAGVGVGAAQAGAADLRVLCPSNSITAGTRSAIPNPWWSTDQSGSLSRVEVMPMGRQQVLVCYYDLNGIEWSVQRKPPAKAPHCRTSGLEFACARKEASADSTHLCQLRPDPGPCKAAYRRYYFDADAKQCRSFTWGGCDGSAPFESRRACESACLGG